MLPCMILMAEARTFDGVRIEAGGMLGGTASAEMATQTTTLPGYALAVGPDFRLGRWDVGGRGTLLAGSAPLGWEESTWLGQEFRVGREVETGGKALVMVGGGLGGGLAVYARSKYDCWGSAGDLWIVQWDTRECGYVTEHRYAAVATLSAGVEVSPRSRTVGLSGRVRARTDATVTGEVGVLFGAGPSRVRAGDNDGRETSEASDVRGWTPM